MSIVYSKCCLYFVGKSTAMATPHDNRDLKNKRDLWFKMSRFWKAIHWTFGILGVILSTLAAAKGFYEEAVPVLSLVAAVCVGIVSFTSPLNQSAKYLSGYLIMDRALRRYEKNLIDEKELEDCADKAENKVNPDTSPTKTNDH
jgi:hypothetical protein